MSNGAFKSVYFMRPVGMDGPIKIGCSSWPKDRLIELSRWSWCPLEIITHGEGPHLLERAIHKLFAAQRLHMEWFTPCPEMLAGIERVKAGEPVGDAFGLVPKVRKLTYRTEVIWIPAPPEAAS